MAKIDYSGVPEAGSKWDLDGLPVTVDSFKAKGRGGYVHWHSENSIGQVTWSEWKKKARAA